MSIFWLFAPTHSQKEGPIFLCVRTSVPPKGTKSFDTKLRFCLSGRCTNGITSSNNKIKPLLNQEILIDPSLNGILTREKESIVRQGVNINL